MGSELERGPRTHLGPAGAWDPVRMACEATGATAASSTERIQSLWGGYGELVRVHLKGASRASVVVKWARSPALDARSSAVSHARKCRSYDVEVAFYRTLAVRCDEVCRVARLLGHHVRASEWLLVLEDLDDAGFGRRSRDLRAADLESCLVWLASFHARFVDERPHGLWSVGTYWHLGTRREELARRGDHTLAARATELDRALRAARFPTIVHGDAKPANFCFEGDGHRVAAVDFQYTGGGPGIVDVAYLLHGAPSATVAAGVDTYFTRLRAALSPSIDGGALEREWRTLLPVAVADFERFLSCWRG